MGDTPEAQLHDNNTPFSPSSVPYLLGQISGELRGISRLIKDSNESTNRRIDDLARKVDVQTAAINTRIEDHKKEIDERFDSHDQRLSVLESQRTRTRTESAGISAVVPIAIEFIKRMFG